MKKRVIYRYTGDNHILIDGKVVKPGNFISKVWFDFLSPAVTIRQEIKVVDPQEVRYVTHQL